MARHHKYYLALLFIFWMSFSILGFKYIEAYKAKKTEFEACVQYQRGAVSRTHESADIDVRTYQFYLDVAVEKHCSLSK